MHSRHARHSGDRRRPHCGRADTREILREILSWKPRISLSALSYAAWRAEEVEVPLPTVKLLVDMNLSPSWIERLVRHGFEAVRWSTIGAATAPDYEILTWVDEHGFVLITNDLDFSSILAASAAATPSVVQIRSQKLLSDAIVSAVAAAREARRGNIERGRTAPDRQAAARVRVLPLR